MNKNYDVIVCGGGPAGFAASVSTARGGASVLLIEQFNCLGGMATSGLVIEFAKTAGRNGGIFKELIDRMEKLGGISREVAFPSVHVVFDPELLKYVAQQMCEEAGVNILFHTFIESAIIENHTVSGINIVNKSGRQAFNSKVVIDATGDGDVAFSAGASFKKGDGNKNTLQALTLRIRIGGVNMIKDIDWKKVNEIFECERKSGVMKFPYYVTKWLDAGAKGLHGERTFNLDMVTGVDATDAFQLSNAELESRKRVWEFIFFARENIPGWENCYVIDTGAHIGVRETRRIIGDYILTEDDVRCAKKFEDGISKGSFGMDLHVPEEIAPSPDSKALEEHWEKTSCPAGDWYEIPYRCLIPKDIKGLLVAGRCLSADRRAGGSVRIMNTCMNTGQAAGLAASIAIASGICPGDIDGKLLRKKLLEKGADI
jgi:hypothetical protein